MLQREILEQGEWLKKQPLKIVEKLSSGLKNNQSLIVKTVVLKNGEILYNIKITKEKS